MQNDIESLANYLHAVTYARHVGLKRITKTIPGFTFKKLRHNSSHLKSIINRLAPIVQLPPMVFVKVLNGDNTPIQELCSNARHRIKSRNSLKHYLTIVAYTNGETFKSMSYSLNKSQSYINQLISRGTRERMEEELPKLASEFGLPRKVMNDAIKRSRAYHRKFAGGYFGGNPNSSKDKAMKRHLKHFVKTRLKFTDIDLLCKKIDENNGGAIIQVLVEYAVINKMSVDKLKQLLRDAHLTSYISYALSCMKKLETNSRNTQVVQSSKFIRRLKAVRKVTPPFYTDFLVAMLRGIKATVGITGQVNTMKTKGFNLTFDKLMNKEQARQQALKWFPYHSPKNMLNIETENYYAHARQELLDKIRHARLFISDGIHVTDRKTVVDLGHGKEVDIHLYLFRFDCNDNGHEHTEAVQRGIPLYTTHKSAKVRKLLKKYNH